MMTKFTENYKLKYNPYIDFLRAISVLSVVFYHIAPGRVPGGFIGVDIFFVISGYLITKIIIKDFQNFSFFSFYSRRIKRLYPALILVILFTAFFCFLFLSKEQFNLVTRHIFASSVFLVNFNFIFEGGYFDIDSIYKPLLHLWSLSVEEQFYLIWPLTILIIHRLKLNTFKIFIFITIISFLINILLSDNQLINFYFPLSRFWEISVGAILGLLDKSYSNFDFSIKSKRIFNYFFYLSLFGIVASVFLINKNYSFPGWISLLPVCSTFLFIFTCNKKTDTKNQSFNFVFRMMLWIGIISYPLYLWHWPILSIARSVNVEELSITVRILIVLISVILSFLTYFFIEKKIRYNSSNKTPIILFLFLIFIGLLGLLNLKNNFISNYLPTKQLYKGDIGHQKFFEFIKIKFNTCSSKTLASQAGRFMDVVRCYESKFKDSIHTTVLVGDSTAEHFYPGLAILNKFENTAGYFASGLPLRINKKYNLIFDEIIKNSKINIVIISGNWNNFLSENKSKKTLISQIADTVNYLENNNKKVFIVNGTHNFSFLPNICKYKNNFISINKCSEKISLNQLQFIKTLKNSKVNVINTFEELCSLEKCTMQMNRNILYRDKVHLNLEGSNFLAKKIFKVIND